MSSRVSSSTHDSRSMCADAVVSRRASLAADVAQRYGLTSQGTFHANRRVTTCSAATSHTQRESAATNHLQRGSQSSSDPSTVASLSRKVASDVSDVSDFKSHLSTGVVRHGLFKHGINLLVILSIVQVGLEHEFSGAEFRVAFKVWEVFYTVISTFEMLCMLETHRLQYFRSRLRLLDFVVAISSILDLIIFMCVESTRFDEYFSMVRLLRVMRILKVIKVFPGFAVLVDGLFQSFKSMFWIFGLLLLILYAGSIICVTVLGGPNAGFPDYNEGSVKSLALKGFNNYEYFGTLFRSMLTLLSMLLLSEWSLARTIAEVHIGMVPLLILLLVLVTFGVTNVIIGVVVEKTIAAMKVPLEAEVLQEMEFRATMSLELAQVLYDIDLDGDGRISLDELKDGLQRPDLAKRMEDLGLPYGFTATELLHMLDLNGDGKLSEYEFAVGLLRLVSSNDWQRQCLHAMEFGMLHNTMAKLRKDFKTELGLRVRELHSEIRTFMQDVKASWSYSDLRHDRPALVNAQSSSVSWEPLPNAPVFSVAGQEREVRFLSQPGFSNDIVDEETQGFERVVSRSHASVSSEKVSLSKAAASSVSGRQYEIHPLPDRNFWPSNNIVDGQQCGFDYARSTPHPSVSSDQVPPLEHGNYDSLDCWTQDGGRDVMSALGGTIQTIGGHGAIALCHRLQPLDEAAVVDHVPPRERRVHWI